VFLSCDKIKSAEEDSNSRHYLCGKKRFGLKQEAFIDTTDYNMRILALSNNDTTGRWPVKHLIHCQAHCCPYHRIIAFTEIYIQKRMGVLGEYPRAEMISKEAEVNKWQKADSSLIAPCFLHCRNCSRSPEEIICTECACL
jgi:hypothetical protein